MTTPDDEDQGATPDRAPDGEGPERYWRPLVEEESLRPVILAVALALMSVGGWTVLMMVRDRHPVALVFGLLLGILSTEAIIRNRRKLARFGVVSWSIGVLWIGSALAAILWNIAGVI